MCRFFSYPSRATRNSSCAFSAVCSDDDGFTRTQTIEPVPSEWQTQQAIESPWMEKDAIETETGGHERMAETVYIVGEPSQEHQQVLV